MAKLSFSRHGHIYLPLRLDTITISCPSGIQFLLDGFPSTTHTVLAFSEYLLASHYTWLSLPPMQPVLFPSWFIHFVKIVIRFSVFNTRDSINVSQNGNGTSDVEWSLPQTLPDVWSAFLHGMLSSRQPRTPIHQLDRRTRVAYSQPCIVSAHIWYVGAPSCWAPNKLSYLPRIYPCARCMICSQLRAWRTPYAVDLDLGIGQLAGSWSFLYQLIMGKKEKNKSADWLPCCRLSIARLVLMRTYIYSSLPRKSSQTQIVSDSDLW